MSEHAESFFFWLRVYQVNGCTCTKTEFMVRSIAADLISGDY
jgi:hypothetical protein